MVSSVKLEGEGEGEDETDNRDNAHPHSQVRRQDCVVRGE